MMRTLLLSVLVGALFVQAPAKPPKEAYPGQSEHAKPPDDFFCTPAAKDAAHRCACKRMATLTEDEAKAKVCCTEIPPERVQEDAKCTVFCHKDHCQCPVTCAVQGATHAAHTR